MTNISHTWSHIHIYIFVIPIHTYLDMWHQSSSDPESFFYHILSIMKSKFLWSRTFKPLQFHNKCCLPPLHGFGITLWCMDWVGPRATDTQWRHKSKITEKLGRCGRQNMLPPYLKIWEWEWIFGHAVKAICSLGVRSPWVGHLKSLTCTILLHD